MTFHDLVEKIVDKLVLISKNNPEKIQGCKKGEDFELIVCEAIEQVKKEGHYDFEISYKKNSHRFPDIVLIRNNGEKYGIEVKALTSDQKGWKINGNSILGSTREPNVKETYIIFGKTQNLEFKFGPYQQYVSDIVVSHSPRYVIDMDLQPGKDFFSKSEIPYAELVKSNDPIDVITTYFRKQGKQAWWIGNKPVSASVQKWGNLSNEKKEECFSYCFAHFPEMFSTRSRTKYERMKTWLLAVQNIYPVRDIFSAGGKTSVTSITTSGNGGTTYNNVPHIYSILISNKEKVKELLSAKDKSLYDDWRFLDKDSKKINKSRKPYYVWRDLVVEQMGKKFLNGKDASQFIDNIMK